MHVADTESDVVPDRPTPRARNTLRPLASAQQRLCRPTTSGPRVPPRPPRMAPTGAASYAADTATRTDVHGDESRYPTRRGAGFPDAAGLAHGPLLRFGRQRSPSLQLVLLSPRRRFEGRGLSKQRRAARADTSIRTVRRMLRMRDRGRCGNSWAARIWVGGEVCCGRGCGWCRGRGGCPASSRSQRARPGRGADIGGGP